MSAAPLPGQCATCRRFHAEYTDLADPDVCDSNELKCDAFPGGIRWSIQLGHFDHTSPYPGDHGLMYEPWQP